MSLTPNKFIRAFFIMPLLCFHVWALPSLLAYLSKCKVRCYFMVKFSRFVFTVKVMLFKIRRSVSGQMDFNYRVAILILSMLPFIINLIKCFHQPALYYPYLLARFLLLLFAHCLQFHCKNLHPRCYERILCGKALPL